VCVQGGVCCACVRVKRGESETDSCGVCVLGCVFCVRLRVRVGERARERAHARERKRERESEAFIDAHAQSYTHTSMFLLENTQTHIVTRAY